MILNCDACNIMPAAGRGECEACGAAPSEFKGLCEPCGDMPGATISNCDNCGHVSAMYLKRPQVLHQHMTAAFGAAPEKANILHMKPPGMRGTNTISGQHSAGRGN